MNTPQIPRRRRAPDASDSACFSCFYTKHPCSKPSTGCCRDCKSKLLYQGSVEHAPFLLQSHVISHLRRLVDSIDPMPDSTPANLTLSYQKSTEPIDTPFSVYVDGWETFYPRNQDLTRCMDQMIWDNFSLKMEGRNSRWSLIRYATLAGGYLCLIFPVESDSTIQQSSGSSCLVEDMLKKRKVIFSIFRFGELVGDIINSMRAVGSGTIDNTQSLTAIAAAGVLYCEIRYTLEGFYGSPSIQLLCDDDELRDAMRTWLRQLERDILFMLQNTCATFQNWGINLRQSRKEAKRDFRLTKISMALVPIAPEMSLSTSSKGFSSPSSSHFDAVLVKTSSSTSATDSPPPWKGGSMSAIDTQTSHESWMAQAGQHGLAKQMSSDKQAYFGNHDFLASQPQIQPSHQVHENNEIWSSGNVSHDIAIVKKDKDLFGHSSPATSIDQLQDVDSSWAPDFDRYGMAIGESTPVPPVDLSAESWPKKDHYVKSIYPPESHVYATVVDDYQSINDDQCPPDGALAMDLGWETLFENEKELLLTSGASQLLKESPFHVPASSLHNSDADTAEPMASRHTLWLPHIRLREPSSGSTTFLQRWNRGCDTS